MPAAILTTIYIIAALSQIWLARIAPPSIRPLFVFGAVLLLFLGTVELWTDLFFYLIYPFYKNQRPRKREREQNKKIL